MVNINVKPSELTARKMMETFNLKENNRLNPHVASQNALRSKIMGGSWQSKKDAYLGTDWNDLGIDRCM